MRKALLLLVVAVAACVAAGPKPGVVAATPETPAVNAVPSAAASDATDLTLIFTGDVRGYLGPCGCSENMRGGIGRAAQIVESARNEGREVLFIDTGDSLFGSTTLTAAETPQQQRKAEALAQAFKKMNLAVRDIGPRDLALGSEFKKSLQLPELGQGDDVEGVRVFHIGGHKVAVFARNAGDEVAEVSTRLKAQGATLVVALLRQPIAEALVVSQRDDVKADLLIATRPDGEFSSEENRLVGTRVKVAQLQSKGRSLLRVDATLRPGAFQWLKGNDEVKKELSALEERIRLLAADVDRLQLPSPEHDLKQAKLIELMKRRVAAEGWKPKAPPDAPSGWVSFVPLETSVPPLPAVDALVRDYDRDVGLINLAWAKEHGTDCAAPPKGTASYVGTQMCAGCHLAAFTTWQGTKHAHALQTLETAGKQYHLDCVGCHVTGWQKPSGVCRVDALEPRRDVGCEVCHGPGSAHVAKPTKKTIVRSVTADTCVGCHTPENSVHFNFETYLPQILGPGHKLAASGKLAPTRKGK